MSAGDELIDSLREALEHAPDNIALRRRLAEALSARLRFEEAEAEYRRALAQAPADHRLKLGLAEVFSRQDKQSAALVIVEDLLSQADTPPAAYVLHARLLLRTGEVQRAVTQYKQAIDLDPEAADPKLAEQLGIGDEYAESEVHEGRVHAGYESAGPAPREIERPRITFADVGGMEQLKEEIRLKILYPLEHPEIYRAYGKSIGGGILMYGPPGCGKTHLARATAGEIKSGFMSVGINDVLNMWLGNSERNLHELFEQARRNAPCVLFFDEVDALGARRTDMQQSSARHLINQFLAELDGVETSNEGVLILAATNSPWHVDPAFRRPGRFDRILFVYPPDQPARASILQIVLKGKPIGNIDYAQIAKKTDNYSGADLKAVVDMAIERKLQQALKTGRPEPLVTQDLLSVLSAVKPTTREWFSTARNYALYANQDGLYDDIIQYLKLS